MSELGELQEKFPLMLANLIIYIYEQGYTVRFGEGYDDDGVGHKKNSLHYIKLAIDLNLFKDGVWLDKGIEMEKAHNLIHDKWDSLGGADRIMNDLNHYSLEYRGMR